MPRFAKKILALTIRRPFVVLTACAIGSLVLATIGVGVEGKLRDSDVVLEGTPSAAATALEKDRFGDTQNVIVLLRGPKQELDRQGRKLANRLDRLSSIEVISAWSPGTKEILTKGPNNALIVAQVHRPLQDTIHNVLPRVRSEVDSGVSEPVRAHLTGSPPLAEAVIKQNTDGTKRAELIAAPLVLLVLLLVFRSPIAAAIPALIGFAVIATGRGLIALFARSLELDTMALNLMSGMGLALGVDYSLLVVSRFREELNSGLSSGAAVRSVLASSGRTVFFAGTVLVVAMSVAFVMAPGNLLASVMFGVIGATVLSLIFTLTALPAMLALIGPKIDLWRVRGGHRKGSSNLAKRAVARPVLTIVVALVPLLAFVIPAQAIKFGAIAPDNLPKDNQARKDFDALRKTFGLGWAGPYEIIAATSRGPITDAKRLKLLDNFQHNVAKLPGVDKVIGPGVIAEPASQAQRAAVQLKQSHGRLKSLNKGLERARRGSQQLQQGLARAADGSGQLAGSQSTDGAEKISGGLTRSAAGLDSVYHGLDRTAGGSRRLTSALRAARNGTAQLNSGTRSAERGATDLARSMHRLSASLGEGDSQFAQLRDAASDTETRLKSALNNLDAMALSVKSDAHYRQIYTDIATSLATVSGSNPLSGQAVKDRYEGFASSMNSAISQTVTAAKGAKQIASGTDRLRQGLLKLRRGTARLEHALAKTASGGNHLQSGLTRLKDGSHKLSNGTKRLAGGSRRLKSGAEQIARGVGQLHSGLDRGAANSEQLSSGLERMSNGVQRLGSSNSPAGSTKHAQAALGSGYFVLAGLDKSPPENRKVANFVINVDRGGTAARIVVLPHLYSGAAVKDKLGPQLANRANALSKKINVQVGVAGRGAVMHDYKARAIDDLLPLITALLLTIFLILVVMFRSLLIAVKAVLLNLLTLAVALGVLKLAFQGTSPPLGGAGYIEIISFYALYVVIFALSMDYEIFLIARMREGYLKTGFNKAAIEYGIERTAGVITGAVAIMVAIFISFAVVGIGQLAQFGIGLTVALVIDATVVRLLLLPATMSLFGDANWWLPARLDRVLPEISFASVLKR